MLTFGICPPPPLSISSLLTPLLVFALHGSARPVQRRYRTALPEPSAEAFIRAAADGHAGTEPIRHSDAAGAEMETMEERAMRRRLRAWLTLRQYLAVGLVLVSPLLQYVAAGMHVAMLAMLVLFTRCTRRICLLQALHSLMGTLLLPF